MELRLEQLQGHYVALYREGGGTVFGFLAQADEDVVHVSQAYKSERAGQKGLPDYLELFSDAASLEGLNVWELPRNEINFASDITEKVYEHEQSLESMAE